MPIINLNEPPSRSMQRWFGLSLAILLVVLTLGVTPLGSPLSNALLVLALATAGLYYCVPSTQLAIIRTWQKITYPIAWTIGHILFAAIFFGIVCPIGFCLRLRGYDPLRLRNGQRSSNWRERKPNDTAEQFFRQF